MYLYSLKNEEVEKNETLKEPEDKPKNQKIWNKIRKDSSHFYIILQF